MTTRQPLPIEWPSDGLIPAVIQDVESRDVLMVGFMNSEALDHTRESGFVHFWSRSRAKLWKKGETSGHVQRVLNIFVNCEQNSLLIEVDQTGAVCHDGYPTCYYRRLEADNSLQVVRDRWFDPNDVYGAGSGQRATLTLWWGAFEFLRDHDLTAQSGTSRRLRDRETSLVPRIKDELEELAGVLDGTHTHSSQKDDLLLEASQVCYWIATELIRQGATYDDVRPDRAMDISPEDAASPITVAKLARGAAQDLDDGLFVATQGHALFTLVASAAVSLGIAPMDVIERDLNDLRGRDYLAPYFDL
jgi:phosphoribosyl-AMP cyclohydrolase